MNIIEKLINFGLSDKEARVYIALLELETAPVQDITDKTCLNRSSIYVVLNSLQKRGLVSISSTEGATKYVATQPDHLSRLAKENVDKYIILKQNFNTLLPQLKKIYRGAIFKPRVTIYIGENGIKNSFENTLQSKEKLIRISSSVGLIFQILPNYLPLYVEKRLKIGLKMLSIHPNDCAVQEMMKTQTKKFDEPILIPENKYLFPSDLAIFDNTFSLMTTKDLFAVEIESKDLSDTVKTLFDLAREEAKRLSKTIDKPTQTENNSKLS